MAFIWNDESLAILRENAGILTTEQIAQLLHTNITAVRNMAATVPWKVRANMTHNGRQFVPLLQRLAVRRRLCVSGFASMSGIPGAEMEGSPVLNVSV